MTQSIAGVLIITFSFFRQYHCMHIQWSVAITDITLRLQKQLNVTSYTFEHTDKLVIFLAPIIIIIINNIIILLYYYIIIINIKLVFLSSTFFFRILRIF